MSEPEFPDDPTEKQVEFIVALLRTMSMQDRKRVLDEADEFMCLLCGGDQKCYCAPCYDE
jgi:hypothetical protein